MKKTLLVFKIVVLLTVNTFAEGVETVFQQANQSYEAKEYEEAEKLYYDVLKAGVRSSELYYNLANVSYRLDRLGQAILYYERAKVLSPHDADIEHNLQLARKKIVDQMEVVPDFFLSAWWKSIRNSSSSTVFGAVALLFLWGGVAGVCFWMIGVTRQQRKVGFLTGAICLILSALPFALALDRLDFEANSRQAIVMKKKASFRSAPDEASKELLELHEGTKVQLLDQLSGWQQVKLPNGVTGWLSGAALEQI